MVRSTFLLCSLRIAAYFVGTTAYIDVIAFCRGAMMAANGLRTVGDVCSPEGRKRIFCDLSATAAKDLSAIEIARHYPRHSVIYF